jgi:hypothetical protein
VKTPLSFQQKAQCWTRRYEQLREQVLTGDNSIATDRRGLTVLIAEGMAAWMRAWHEPLCCSRSARSRSVVNEPGRVLAAGSNPAAGQYGVKPSSHLSPKVFNA